MTSRDALAASKPTQPRRVLIVGAAPAQLLDIAGPAEVLAQAAACDHGVVVSEEEHNVTSGFGSAVAEMLAAHGAGARLVRIGMPDPFSIPGPLRACIGILAWTRKGSRQWCGVRYKPEQG